MSLSLPVFSRFKEIKENKASLTQSTMVQKYQSPVRVYKHPFELVMKAYEVLKLLLFP